MPLPAYTVAVPVKKTCECTRTKLSTTTPGAIVLIGIKSLGSGMVRNQLVSSSPRMILSLPLAIHLRSVGRPLNISRTIQVTLTFKGIPKIFNSKTLMTEVVANDPDRIAYKQRQQYNPRGTENAGWTADSLVTLVLDDKGKVKYHKDMWNEKDYRHEGLGKLMKTLNGQYLTKITRPEKSLKEGP